MSDSDAAYFRRVGEHVFRPTRHTGGSWSPDEQHVAPLMGIVVHAIDRHLAASGGAEDGKVITRLGVDILGVIPIADCDVTVRIIRPGRTIELVEVTVIARARAVLQARAWRMAGFDTQSVTGTEIAAMPPPDEVPMWDMTSVWDGHYIASIDVRREVEAKPGRSRSWLSTAVPLVAGEPVSPLASYVGMVDVANGIAVRQHPTEWAFPNLDLTIHLHRQPVGLPVGLDTTVTFGPHGHGHTSTVLHDEFGPVGHASQILTVRRQ